MDHTIDRRSTADDTLSTYYHIDRQRPTAGIPGAMPMCMQTTITTLRGLGRYAYRHGKNASQAIQHAQSTLGHTLTTDERKLVMAGWAAERSDLTTEG